MTAPASFPPSLIAVEMVMLRPMAIVSLLLCVPSRVSIRMYLRLVRQHLVKGGHAAGLLLECIVDPLDQWAGLVFLNGMNLHGVPPMSRAHGALPHRSPSRSDDAGPSDQWRREPKRKPG